MNQDPATNRPDGQEDRWELLRQLDGLLDAPMVALSFTWLGLVILDLTVGPSRFLEALTYVVWGLFGLHFLLGFLIAPQKGRYLRQHWLTAVALLLPAFRILRVLRAFRLLRAARATRSLNLVRVLTTLNRGMRAVGGAMGRRGVGYVAALTAVVSLAGAAGMAAFESPAALRAAGHEQVAVGSGGLASYGEALWWTAMLMTTIGSDYWPKTLEGRILGWLLAVYALAVFGYITATIASFFVGQDVRVGRAEPAAQASKAETAALHEDVAALRAQVTALNRLLGRSSLPHSQIDEEDGNTRRA